ncbi:MAG: Mut7-C RNAse domain-containing protein [Bdellovibrionia bacterium]
MLDVHLARLCKYLRMVGLDCLWKSDYSDEELRSISSAEKRFLLTRDRVLFEKADPDFAYYVQAILPQEQLEEVVKNFQLGKWIRNGEHFLSRCLECNTLVKSLQMGQLPESVPESIKVRHNEFFFCPTCQRVYWKGSHFDRTKEWLKTVSDADPDTRFA